MSKERQKNSWEYVEARCEALFGDSRFQEKDGVLSIIFDLESPVQRHEHDSFLLNMQRQGIEWSASCPAHTEDGSKIIVPDKNEMKLSVSIDALTPDQMNDFILPLMSFTQTVGQNTRHYNDNNQHLELLQKLTGKMWSMHLPKPPYTEKAALVPVRQTRGLTPEQREAQERLIFEAFIPASQMPAVRAREWVNRQQEIEDEKGLECATVIPDEFLPSDRYARWHQSEQESHTSRLLREAFKPQNNSRDIG